MTERDKRQAEWAKEITDQVIAITRQVTLLTHKLESLEKANEWPEEDNRFILEKSKSMPES